jgi:hypothetical protein
VSAHFSSGMGEFRLPGQTASGHRLELTWDTPEVAPEGRDLQPGHTNYLIGRDSTKWIRNIPLYGAVEYPQTYPGILLLFYGNGDSLEHDFKLSAGADPGQITLRLKGADKVKIDSQRNLADHRHFDGNSFPEVGNLPSIAQCPNGGGCYFLVSLKQDGSAFNYSGMLLAEQSNYANNGAVAAF